MPKVGTSREGTSSSSPRGGRVGTSRSSSGKVTRPARAARNPLTGGALPNSATVQRQIRDAGNRHVGPGPGFTPVRMVLDAVSAPLYVVGNAAHGNPKGAALTYLTMGQTNQRTPSTAPVVKSVINKLPDKWYLRQTAGFGVDMALDPLTYLTFGVGGAAKGVAGAAARDATEAAAARARSVAQRAVEENRRLTAKEAVDIEIDAAKARRARPTTVKVNFRTPLTRGKTRTLVESRALAVGGEKLGGKLKDTSLVRGLRERFRADGGINPIERAGQLGAINWSKGVYEEIISHLNEGAKVAAKERVEPSWIFRHIDDPENYPVPDARHQRALEAAVRARDEAEAVARENGIEMGYFTDYAPHRPKNDRARAKRDRLTHSSPNNAGYTMERSSRFQRASDYDKAGIQLEENIFDLLKRRAQQGVTDAAVKGYKDSRAAAVGRRPPLKKVPDVEGQRAVVAEARDDLATASQKVETKGLREGAKGAKQRRKAAEKALRVALRSKDEAAISRARRELEAAEEAAEPAAVLSRPEVVEALQGAMDELPALSASKEATRAILPNNQAQLDQINARMEELRQVWEPVIREAARSEWRQPGGRFHPVGSSGHAEGVARAKAKGRKFKEGGRKSQAMRFTRSIEDIYEDVRDQARRLGVEDEVTRAYDEWEQLHGEALRLAGKSDRSKAQAFLEDGEGLPSPDVARSLRENNASPTETPAAARNAGPDGPQAPTPREARRKFNRYFNDPEGPISGKIRAVREGAEAEIEAATKGAQREVNKAEKLLAKARASNDAEAVKWAKGLLREAKASEKMILRELDRARVMYGATPAQVAKRVRVLVREQKRLRDMEKKAQKAATLNSKALTRQGKVVDWEKYQRYKERGWEEMSSKYLEGTLLPPWVADAVRHLEKQTGYMVRDVDELTKFTRFFTQVGSRWKGLQLMTPRYHLRNLVDDAIVDWMAGVRSPKSYSDAAAVMRGHAGSITGKAVGEIPFEELLIHARIGGVFGTGEVAADFARQARRAGKGKLIPSVPGDGQIASGSRYIGEARENWTRLAHYIERLKAGDTFEEAARSVRRWRFDYSDMAPALMKMRTFLIPFLTFTWKNGPMMAKLIAERPGALSHTNTIVEYLNEVGGDPDRSLLAPWEADSFGVPAPGFVKSAFGAKTDEPLLFNPRITLRYADAEMLNPDRDAIIRNWGGMVGPVKLPLEMLTGYSTFQARQLRPGERVKAPALIKFLHDRGIPIAGWGPKNTYDSQGNKVKVDGYSALLNMALGVIPPLQQANGIIPGGSVDAKPGFMRYATGANLRGEDRARAAALAERFAR